MRLAIAATLAVGLLAPGAETRAEDQDGKITWNLTDLYATPEAWGTERLALLEIIPTLDRFEGRLGESAALLIEASLSSNNVPVEVYDALIEAVNEGVTTFAHEWGHAVHSMLARRDPPWETANYAIFRAEIASNTTEVFLQEYNLKNAGIDLATKAPYRSLIARMGTIMDEIESIVAEKE